MSENRERKAYKAPLAQDLSAFGAAGSHVGPMGYCSDGHYPYTNCLVGSVFVGSCTDGSQADTSSCGGGAIHSFPACKVGSSAITGCTSGSHQNF